MADNNSTGPKTVPLKKTSSIPLKKETVRVSVKADPAKPPQDTGATPPPLPTATSVKTVPLSEAMAPGNTPVVKTVALDGGAPSLPPKTPSKGSDNVVPEIKTTPLTAPANKAPQLAPPTAIKTQPLNAPPVIPSPPKTSPIPGTGAVAVPGPGPVPSSPIATTPMAPTASAPLVAPPLASPSTPVQTSPTPSSSLPTSPVGASVNTAPTMTRSIQQTEIIKSRWPIAIAALVLAMGLCGLTIWEYYAAVGNSL